jgi:hypothetical protein
LWPDACLIGPEPTKCSPHSLCNSKMMGTVIHLPLYARSQASLLEGEGASPRPTGPIVALRVVGIEASEVDFPAGSAPLDELLVTPAFRRTVMRRTANNIGYAIRLKGGASELPRFDAEVGALKAPAGVANEDGESRSVEASIHGQTIGWWILALIAAIVGVAVLYQVLARQAAAERVEYPTLTALGPIDASCCHWGWHDRWWWHRPAPLAPSSWHSSFPRSPRWEKRDSLNRRLVSGKRPEHPEEVQVTASVPSAVWKWSEILL